MRGESIIIGLSGKMKAGKSTLAQRLVEEYGFVKLSFGDFVRQEVAKGMGMTLSQYKIYEIDNKQELRPIMQAWGHGRRQMDGDNYWVEKVFETIEGMERDTNDEVKYTVRIVIDDVRYPNELNAIKKRGGQVGWLEVSESNQLERGADEGRIGHDSETALDEYKWVPSWIVDTDMSSSEEVFTFIEWWMFVNGYIS